MGLAVLAPRQIAAHLLLHSDIKRVSLVCKTWREALRPLVLRRLHLLLSDIDVGAAHRTEHLADLKKLLKYAGLSATLSLAQPRPAPRPG